METMSIKELLLKTLEDLGDEEFKDFKWYLQQPDLLEGVPIPKSHLDKANRRQTVDKIVQSYSHQSVEMMKKILKKISRNDLVEKLPSTGTGAPVFYPDVMPQQTTTPYPPSPPQESYISEKYKDIISRSDSVHSGSPAVYQLRPEKKTDPLTRLTVGERNVNKINKTILLVGETGTGKSTLVNTLVNYTMGVTFEDDIWFQVVEEEKRSQCESQTSDVIVYEIFGFEEKTLPYSLTIIDTPGYGDITGIKHNVNISQKLLDLFRSEDGVHDINAVGLVLKATENRLSGRMRYVFDSVTSLFGKNLEENIVALITHSDGRTPENVLKALEAANIKCAKNEKNQPAHFLFDNCQNMQRAERNKSAISQAWGITEGELSHFTDFLEKCGPQKVEKTVHVLKSRIGLTDCIQNLQDRIMLIELKQTEIKQTQEALKKHEQEMKKNEKFTVEVDEVYKDRDTVDGGRQWLFFNEGAVTCNICEETCHYPCTMARSPGGCNVMKGGRCTVCTKKCPVADHVKDKWRFVKKTRKVQKTEEEMKDKYEKNKAEFEKKSSVLKNLEKEIKDLTAERSQFLEESYQHVVSLDQIALNVDSLSTHVHLDFLVEKMKEKGDTEKVQKLEETMRRVDKGTRAGLLYVGGKLTAGREIRRQSR